MKTPKRDYELTTMEHSASERVWDRAQEHVSAQRWKRKNRVKHLKRSLEKYKYGIHLSGSVAAAYRRLQCAVRPGEHATLAEWANYLHELRRIQEHITDAISNTAIILAYDAGRGRLNVWPQSAIEKHRFMTEAFGIPDETDRKEQQ